MAQLEKITLECSYLLSAQLEQQKQVHDAEVRALTRQLKDAQNKASEGEQWRKKYILAQDAQKAVTASLVPGLEQSKLQAELKCERMVQLARQLQDDLRSERALSSGLMTRLKTMEQARETDQTMHAAETTRRAAQVVELEDMIKDLTFALSMRDQVKGSEAEGGDLVVQGNPPEAKGVDGAKTGKNKKKKK